MRINLLQLSMVLATTLVTLAGCGSNPDNTPKQARNGAAGYTCQDEAVIVTAAAVDRELLYVCDDGAKKITWKFDTTNVKGVSIEFKPDYPFNGSPRPIISRPGDDHVDSPPIPKKPRLMLYKYFITITSASGQTTLPDPHVLSGGSY
jgi:hypothetical protein